MSRAAQRNIIRKFRHCGNIATALKVRQQNRFYVLPRNCDSTVYKVYQISSCDFELHRPERTPEFFEPLVGTIFQLLIYFNLKNFSD
jgi:hypothetical protein